MTTIDEQVATLMSGTAYGDAATRENMTRELRARLLECEETGRPLRVYCGYDPRTSDLHLGHTITMRKLRQFQDFGHDVTFLIGTFTSMIGDPSDKDTAREQLRMQSVDDNARTYAEQAFKILDEDKTRVRRNDEWLSPLDFADIIRLASHFTVQQFLVRENFSKRIDDGKAIFLHEFFYALMQAYDAVAQEADAQVGGQDQLFKHPSSPGESCKAVSGRSRRSPSSWARACQAPMARSRCPRASATISRCCQSPGTCSARS